MLSSFVVCSAQLLEFIEHPDVLGVGEVPMHDRLECADQFCFPQRALPLLDNDHFFRLSRIPRSMIHVDENLWLLQRSPMAVKKVLEE